MAMRATEKGVVLTGDRSTEGSTEGRWSTGVGSY